MAFRDTIDLIKRTRQDMQATSRGVRDASKTYDAFVHEIALAKRRLKYKEGTEHVEVYSRAIIRAMKREKFARNILIKEIDDAIIRSGKEFEDYDKLYKYYLYLVADSDDIYKFITVGAGWNIRLAQQLIVFEEVAGDINDYARGISAYRSSLGTKTKAGTNRGLHATNWWLENVYGDSKYETTVEGRIGISGRTAPFWKLIAKGSMSLPSDRPDASYNPFPAKGVDFVTNTEDLLRKEFRTRIEADRTIWTEETKQFSEEIRYAESLRDSFSKELRELKIEYKDNQRIIKSFGDKGKYISEQRLATVARELRAGKEFDTESVELTKPRSKTRVRPTIRKLEGLLGY